MPKNTIKKLEDLKATIDKDEIALYTKLVQKMKNEKMDMSDLIDGLEQISNYREQVAKRLSYKKTWSNYNK